VAAGLQHPPTAQPDAQGSKAGGGFRLEVMATGISLQVGGWVGRCTLAIDGGVGRRQAEVVAPFRSLGLVHDSPGIRCWSSSHHWQEVSSQAQSGFPYECVHTYG
jgi:hypothetical protein